VHFTCRAAHILCLGSHITCRGSHTNVVGQTLHVVGYMSWVTTHPRVRRFDVVGNILMSWVTILMSWVTTHPRGEIQKSSWTDDLVSRSFFSCGHVVACVRTMDITINLQELVTLHQRKQFIQSPLSQFTSAKEIPAGEVVVCSDSSLANFTIGKVVTSGDVIQLPKDHQDGTEAELFVSEFNKTRTVTADPGLCVCVCVFSFYLHAASARYLLYFVLVFFCVCVDVC